MCPWAIVCPSTPSDPTSGRCSSPPNRMVIVLTLPDGSGLIDAFVKKHDRSFARRVSEITYHEFAQRGIAPSAAYIFADRQRMSPAQRLLAGELWDRLKAAGFPLYNDPRKQLGRYEL